jgi:hypothetical protein
MMERDYVIWSFEHRAWWRPAKCGYTEQFAEAGRYSKDDADAIVVKANRYVKWPHEQAMLLSTAQAYVARGWYPLTPGTYDDGRGGLHLVLDEMLAAHGYADTPENRQALIDAARAAHGTVDVT